jgi:hypothetical protein
LDSIVSIFIVTLLSRCFPAILNFLLLSELYYINWGHK